MNLKSNFEQTKEIFTTRRSKELNEHNQTFRAYAERLIRDLRTDYENQTRVDTCNFIYEQRLLKSLFDAFQVFFIPEAMHLYKGLELMNPQKPFSGRTYVSPEQENELSVALGQVTLLTLHLSKCLGIPLFSPLIYCSNRSSIVIGEQGAETKVLPLYLGQSKQDIRTLDQAISLLHNN